MEYLNHLGAQSNENEDRIRPFHEVSFGLTENDADRNGHFNHKEWIESLDTATLMALKEKGITLDNALERWGVRIFVAHNEFSYLREAKPGQSFTIHTSINNVGNTSITLEQEVFVDGERAGTAKWVLVCVDENGKKSLPQEMRTALES